MIQLRHRTFLVTLTLAVVAGVALGAFAAGGGDRMIRPAVAPMVDAPILPVQMPLTTGSFSKVADLVKPAVVNINTVSKGGLPGRTPFEEFFGEEFYKRFFGDTPERIPQRSLGSGVIVDPSGIALTNAHVVERATEIEIITLDGSKHKAKVIGLDKKTDLAVLKLDDGKATRIRGRKARRTWHDIRFLEELLRHEPQKYIYLFHVPPKCIKAIIFGCKISSQDERTIVRLLSRSHYSHVKKYRATMDEQKFKLNVVGWKPRTSPRHT